MVGDAVGDAANRPEPARPRRLLARMDVLPHRGRDAVGANQHVACNGVPSASVASTHRRALRWTRPRCSTAAKTRRPLRAARRAAPGEAPRPPARPAPRGRATCRTIAGSSRRDDASRPSDLDAAPQDHIGQAERAQRVHRVRREQQREAEFARRRRPARGCGPTSRPAAARDRPPARRYRRRQSPRNGS